MFITFINLNSKYVFMHNKIPRVNSRSFYSLSCTESTTKEGKKSKERWEKFHFSNHNIFLYRLHRIRSWADKFTMFLVFNRPRWAEYILNFIFHLQQQHSNDVFNPAIMGGVGWGGGKRFPRDKTYILNSLLFISRSLFDTTLELHINSHGTQKTFKVLYDEK